MQNFKSILRIYFMDQISGHLKNITIYLDQEIPKPLRYTDYIMARTCTALFLKFLIMIVFKRCRFFKTKSSNIITRYFE